MTTETTPVRSYLSETSSAWDRFWFAPSDPATLGMMRICTGIIVLYVHFSFSFGLLDYLSGEGWLDAPAGQYLRHDIAMYTLGTDWETSEVYIASGQPFWSIFYHLESPGWFYAVHALFFVVILLFLLGQWTPITAVLAWIAYMNYVHRVPIMLFGMDTMISIGMFYLMLSPCGSAYSLDRWWQRRRLRQQTGEATAELPVEKLASATFITRLVQIHFCVVYFAAGTSKLLGSSWWSGNALWGTVANYSFAPMDFPPYLEVLTFLSRHRPLWEVAMTSGVVFTLVMEVGLPFMIWTRWRPLWVIGGIGLHFGIGLFMGLRVFSMMMMVLLFSFVPPEVVRTQIDRLLRRTPASVEVRS